MGVRAIKSLNLSLVCLRVFFASFIGIVGVARTPGIGRRAHAAVVVSLNFRMVAELRLTRRTCKMIQRGGNSGAEMQPPAGLGMPMQPGLPTRLEAGQANGAEGTSSTGNVNAGAPGQTGVGISRHDSWELSWCRDLSCWSVRCCR